jgi:hypothetical protein
MITMKVEKRFGNDKIQGIEVGDMIEISNNIYLISQYDGEFTARSFDGYSGATGIHESLEKLEASFGRFNNVAHYPKGSYKLVLERNE